MNDSSKEPARFEMQDGERSRLSGPLEFATVGALLPLGADAIAKGRAAVIDLAGVTAGDSAGLALLIEWLSIAHTQKRALRYENLPSQLNQLAELSEVEELLVPPKSTDGPEPRLP